MMKEKHILFVCKYHRFRSKVAEAWFRKLNKNQNLKVKSAGVIRGSPIDNEIFEACRKVGIKISNKREGLSTDLLTWQDVLIIVADDVPLKLFSNEKYGKQTLVWKIKDTDGDVDAMIPIIMDIGIKVKKLLEDLEDE